MARVERKGVKHDGAWFDAPMLFVKQGQQVEVKPCGQLPDRVQVWAGGQYFCDAVRQ